MIHGLRSEAAERIGRRCSNSWIVRAKIARAMSAHLLNEAMKAQLALEWDRLRKALSQAGDIGNLNLMELQIVEPQDRRSLPPALSVGAIQGVVSAEKGNPHGQTYRAGEESRDQTQ